MHVCWWCVWTCMDILWLSDRAKQIEEGSAHSTICFLNSACKLHHWSYISFSSKYATHPIYTLQMHSDLRQFMHLCTYTLHLLDSIVCVCVWLCLCVCCCCVTAEFFCTLISTSCSQFRKLPVSRTAEVSPSFFYSFWLCFMWLRCGGWIGRISMEGDSLRGCGTGLLWWRQSWSECLLSLFLCVCQCPLSLCTCCRGVPSPESQSPVCRASTAPGKI